MTDSCGQDTCPKCDKDVDPDEREFFECDSCLMKTHKNCAGLSSSEIRVMPLQKRLLMFVCDTCKIFLRRMPRIISMIESVQQDLSALKNKFDEKKNVSENIPIVTYAEKVSGTETKKNIPSLILKPKKPQNSRKTEADLQKNIKPDAVNIGIKNMKEISNGGIVIKCGTTNEIKKLQEEAQRALSNDYEVHLNKLKSPKLKIVNVSSKNPEMTSAQIEDCLRNQNSFIQKDDHLKVVM